MIRKYFFTSENQLRDLGLLLLRIGIGYMFIRHGWPKMFGGIEKWAKLGGNMDAVGIDFAPVFWGFMAAFSEFFGGICLALGLFTRVFAILMGLTMLVATASHFADGDKLMDASHSVEAMILFFGLFFIGPGRLSLDQALFGKDPYDPHF